MVLKTMSRKSNGGQLVAYVCRYVLNPNKGKEPIKAPHHDKEAMQLIIRHNLRARSSVKNFIKEFEENERYRLVHRKDSVKLFHEVISFAKADRQNISEALLKDVAKQFIALRGMNNLYLGAAHYNTASTHLHIIVSGTSLNGRSSRISKQEHQRIKITLEKYQREKYPELTHSRVAHQELFRQPTKEQIVTLVQQNRQTTKAKLCTLLYSAFEKSATIKEFGEHIAAAGYKPYHRGEKFQGVVDEHGMKFRFSRLGFQSNIEALAQQTIAEENALLNIQKLRRAPERARLAQRPIAHQGIQPKQMDTMERRMLEEVAALRSNNVSKERTVDRNERMRTLFDEPRTEEEDDQAVNAAT
jgi:hypothetical protein